MQTSANKPQSVSFLQGGGEMGKLIRAKDWSNTPLGDANEWPQSLRTTLSIVLNSKFPMFLWWGPELTCLYNDAYRPSLGNDGKHPSILGMPAAEAWSEIWSIIKPLIDQVLQGGEATWSEDQLIPIYRNKKIEDVYWTFSYSPVKDEDDNIAGVLVICNETTEKVSTLKRIEESEKRFRSMAESSDILIATGDETGNATYFSKAWVDLTGRPMESLLKFGWVDLVHEEDKERYVNIYLSAFEKKAPFTGEFRVQNKQGGYSSLLAKGSPLFHSDGSFYGYISSCMDITEQVNALKKVEESEQDLHNMVLQAPMGVCVIDAPSLISEIVNDSFIEVAGKRYEQIAGKHYWDTFAEARPYYEAALNKVIEEGIPFYANEVELMLIRHGKEEMIYVTFVYSPLKNTEGKVKKVAVWVLENTLQVKARQKIEEADKRFRNTVKQAPIGITILRGKQYIVEMANEAYLQLVDRKETEFTGRPLFDSLPEVETTIRSLLDDVLNTGTPFHGIEYPIPVNRYGKQELSYFDFLYHPLREEDGKISGIIVTVTDVTASVKAKYSIAESEKQFRNMVIQSPVPMTIFRGHDFVIELANTEMFEKIWRKEEKDVIGKKLLDVFPELEAQKYPDVLNSVYTSGMTHREKESVAYVQGNDGMKKFYFDYEYKPLFEPDGTVSGIMITLNDVTEKVEARQRIADAEERLRLATEAADLSTWDLDLQTREIIYSPRLAEIFGHDKSKKITHAEMRSQIHPDDIHEIVEKAFEEAMQTGIYYYQSRIIHPDKTVHWIRTQGKVILDDNQVPARMLGTILDITDSQIAKEKIATTAAIVQSSDDAIISKTLEGIIMTWNNAAERIFGYTADEMIGQPLIRLIPPDRIHEEPDILARLRKGQRVDHFETKRITKDGRILDISLTISPVRDTDGKIIGASKIARDITSQKEKELTIKANEQKFRLLADSMPQHIWTSDTEGNLNYFNKSVFDYSGLTPEQINKEGWIQIVHPDDRKENIRSWMNSVITGKDFLFEHRFRQHDGEYRWQLSRALPVKDNEGRIQMWVGTSTDIDEIKKSEEEKDDFIKIASHELKTPVTSIKGYIQLLLSQDNGQYDPLLTKSLLTIDKQVTKLTNLITDLLDVSKIEMGKFHYHEETFSLTDLIKEIAENIQATTTVHKIVFNSQTDISVHADKDRISQVLVNLLTNAIKYSPSADKVIIETSVQENELVVSIQDFGIGIANKDQQKIFERFYRVEGAHGKTFPGFGIGLYIVKEIISNHKGKVWLKSEKNKGSTFYFSLPL